MIRAVFRVLAVVAFLAGQIACADVSRPVDFKHLVGYIKTGQVAQLKDSLRGHTREDINFSGRALLTLSAVGSRHPEIIDALADWGIDFNRSVPTTQAGETVEITPLIFAISSNAGDAIVERLIARGADVNRPSGGLTPLGFALSMRQYGVGNLLLDKGADANGSDSIAAMTPLMELAMSARDNDGPMIQDLAKRLVKAGADVNAKTKRGASVLSFCVAGGSASMLRTMLELGADPNIKNDKGESPLDAARRKHRDDLAALLLQSGARQ